MAETSYISSTGQRTATKSQYTSIQSWKKPKQAPISAAQANVVNTLDKAATGKVGAFDATIKNRMAYADAGRVDAGRPTQVISKNPPNESFKFGDVVDVINPLQHIPVVNMIYREVTGDAVHPMAQIIGGALYGGPIGAVTGTANAISKVQTGKDLGDHALSFAGLKTDKLVTQPEIQLTDIATKTNNNAAAIQGLPGSTLALANLSQNEVPAPKIDGGRQQTKAPAAFKSNSAVEFAADLKDALKSPELKNPTLENPALRNLNPKDHITSLQLSAMPQRQNIKTY